MASGKTNHSCLGEPALGLFPLILQAVVFQAGDVGKAISGLPCGLCGPGTEGYPPPPHPVHVPFRDHTRVHAGGQGLKPFFMYFVFVF